MHTNTTVTPAAPSSQPTTLEDIAQKKKEIRLQITQEKQQMQQLLREIIAPMEPAAQSTNAFMRSFNTGMAIFDGVMMGMKIMRKIKLVFRKFR